MTPKERVAALRVVMKTNNVAAFIVYSADPHMSEYLPDEWQERAWLSGFTGSAGFVVVTGDKAGLWTDGRYFTQAQKELEGSGIDLFKQGMEDTPDYIDWIIAQTPIGATIAVNSLATSHVNWMALNDKLVKHKRHLKDLALLNEVWTHRPMPSKNGIFVHPIVFAGQSVTDKIAAIRQKMKAEGATAHIISSLDDVAWTLNLRGSDVNCNPVFLGYILLTLENCTLFVDLDKLNTEANHLMAESGVAVVPYHTFYDQLVQLKNETVLIAPQSNQLIFEVLKENNTILEKPVPGQLMKSIKNESEREGYRAVMVRDGIAMIKFLYWLVHTAGKEPMDEYGIGQKLYNFRTRQKNFVGDSFEVIVGYQANGAIMHYSAKPDGSLKVTNQDSILIDSGGQYLEATTDVTRTLALGDVSDKFKTEATIVLKGMIQLTLAKFPKGTRGIHLDALARMPLWKSGKDYNCGTGHGVGSFLNVHEGPQSIRKEWNPVELEEHMILTNEPGYYVEGQYGIRHENMMIVKLWKKTEWNTFYEFETLTLCPFFKNIIVKDLLSQEEIDWINTYHKNVGDKLGPYLEGDVKTWFETLISPL